jgi:opacity protein-like surface antigen
MCRSIRGIVGLGLLTGLLMPGVAGAQILGVGPRFSLVRGDVATSTPTTRFVGGTARLKSSAFLSLEGSLDYRTTWNTDRTQRVRETPLQGSVLLYPLRGALAPYALGGMGIYTRTYDVLANSVVTQTAQERKVGMHLGFGGEIRLAKHAVVYLDYRYRFVKFSTDQTTTTTTTGAAAQESAIAKLFGSVPGLSNLKASHQGSMWTGGVAFVF